MDMKKHSIWLRSALSNSLYFIDVGEPLYKLKVGHGGTLDSPATGVLGNLFILQDEFDLPNDIILDLFLLQL